MMFRTSLYFVNRLDPLSLSFFVFVIVDFSLVFRCAVGFPHGATCFALSDGLTVLLLLLYLYCLRRMASRSSLSVLVGWPHEDLLSLFQFLSDGLTRTYSYSCRSYCFVGWPHEAQALLMESGFRCTNAAPMRSFRLLTLLLLVVSSIELYITPHGVEGSLMHRLFVL